MTSFPSLLESIDDLSKAQIDGLLARAKFFKHNPEITPLNKTPKPIIATSFLENSTRTKHSFAVAIRRLGGLYLDFNAETSSIKKGESLEETFLTLYYQGISLCVFRSSVSHQLSQFRDHLPIKLVNGGDGINEHPTQALLDLLTLQELSSELKGKTLAIVGDNIHSRVGHSLIKLLPQYGIKIILGGPKDFLPKKETLAPNIELSFSREDIIERSDFIYLLRIQKERHTGVQNELYDNYLEHFGISLDILKKYHKLIPILHPGPANIGVEIDSHLIKSSLYKGYLQVANSIPMRMAIIEAMLLNNDSNIGKINGEKF